MTTPPLGRHFRLLWSASGVSNLGDGVRVAALPLLAASLTRDPAQVAGVGAALWLPWLVFGLHGGAIVDRSHRPALLRNVQVARMVLLVGLAGLVVSGRATVAVLYLVAFCVGLGEVLADSAAQALVPATVRRGDFERANARLTGVQIVGNELVGPPVGGLLFSLHRAAPFLADAVSFGLGSVLAHRLARELPAAPRPEGRSALRTDVAEGARWLVRHPLLRVMALWIGVTNFAFAAFEAVFVLLALEVLGVGEVGYGLLLTAGAAGGVAGTALAAPVARLLGRGRTLVVTMLASGVVLVIVGTSEDPLAVAGLQVLLGLLGVVFNVVGRSLRLALVPDRLTGRVVATFRLLGYGTIPLGALAHGWLASRMGLRAPFVAGGLLVVAAAVAVSPWLRAHRIAQAEAAAAR